jgi:hypothetical protein
MNINLQYLIVLPIYSYKLLQYLSQRIKLSFQIVEEHDRYQKEFKLYQKISNFQISNLN